MQDKLKKNKKKRLNQFQNGLKHVKNRQNRPKRIAKTHNFFQSKKIQNILRNILQNKMEQIKKEINLLHDKLEQFKIKTEFIGKKTKSVAKRTGTNRKNAESFIK